MNAFVAASSPAGALGEKISTGVGLPSDLDTFGVHVGEVALETGICISAAQHFIVTGAVRVVAEGAAFAHCFVFENEWP